MVQVAVRVAVVNVGADEALLIAEQDHDLQHTHSRDSTRPSALKPPGVALCTLCTWPLGSLHSHLIERDF